MGRSTWIQRLSQQARQLPGQPLLELFGQGRILVEHHRGVTEYGREKIVIRVSFGCICIQGLDLELACMSNQQLVITGQIFSVNLLRR